MIGGVVALKGGVPGLPKQAPFIAAAQGPTKVQPPSEDNVASSSDGGASLLKDSGKPAGVKVVTTEEQPVDLTAQASATAPASPAADTGASGASIQQTVDTPVVVMTAPAPPAAPSQFPDPKPVRTVSRFVPTGRQSRR